MVIECSCRYVPYLILLGAGWKSHYATLNHIGTGDIVVSTDVRPSLRTRRQDKGVKKATRVIAPKFLAFLYEPNGT